MESSMKCLIIGYKAEIHGKFKEMIFLILYNSMEMLKK